MASSIYVGPNDKKLGLRQFQIFSGDLPDHVKAALKSSPYLGNFVMPFDQFVNSTPPGTLPARSVAKPTLRQAPPIRKY